MKLKPCPFCGGEVIMIKPCRGINEGGWEIHCFNESCHSFEGSDSKDILIKAWNTRAKEDV